MLIYIVFHFEQDQIQNASAIIAIRFAIHSYSGLGHYISTDILGNKFAYPHFKTRSFECDALK